MLWELILLGSPIGVRYINDILKKIIMFWDRKGALAEHSQKSCLNHSRMLYGKYHYLLIIIK